MAAGKFNMQKASGGVASITVADGVSNTEVVLPESGTVATTDNIVGFKNYIINGNFDIWQRGTSQTISGYGSDDRWHNLSGGSTKTHTMVNATDTERVVFNSSKFSRTVVTSVAGVANSVTKFQYIEDVTRLAGKTVTISFWAKADSNKNIAIELAQIFGTGGSPSSAVITIGSQLVALTNTWQKKTITMTIPSVVGKTLGTDGVHTSSTAIVFWLDAGSSNNARASSLGQQSGTFDIAQVQLEEGSVATPFEQRPYGLELSLCQRYYEVLGTGIGQAKDATSMILHFSSSPKRVPATAILLNGAPYGESPINIIAVVGVSSFIMTMMNQTSTTTSGHILLIKNFSGMVAGSSASISAGQIPLSAEL